MPIKTSLLALAIATAMAGAITLAPITARADEPTSTSVETTAPMPTSEAPAPASTSVETTAPMPTSDAADVATKAANDATEAANKAAAEATAKADAAAKDAAKDKAAAAKTVAKPVKTVAAAPAAAAPAGGVTKASIVAKLKAAGYSDINDLKFEDAVWHADAKDPTGKHSVLTLAANDGHVILSQHD